MGLFKAAMIGGLGLQAYGMFGRKQRMSQGLSKAEMYRNYERRMGQIGDFAQQLAQARAQYQADISNFYSNAFSRFTPLAETQFAARGFNPMGGAYQSALAKQASQYQDAMSLALANRLREDILAVDQAKAGAEAALQGVPLAQPIEDQRGMNFANFGQSLMGLGAFGKMGGFDLLKRQPPPQTEYVQTPYYIPGYGAPPWAGKSNFSLWR